MPHLNLHKPSETWQQDTDASVAAYNAWYRDTAPRVFEDARTAAHQQVLAAMVATHFFRDVTPAVLRATPQLFSVLRLAIVPPLAVDRVSGLCGVDRSIVDGLGDGRLPSRGAALRDLNDTLGKIVGLCIGMADRTLLPWIARGTPPTDQERDLAIAVLTDRLSAATANPFLRNAQEKRQLDLLEERWAQLGLLPGRPTNPNDVGTLPAGRYALRLSVTAEGVKIPIDAVARPVGSRARWPVLIEAKSAGDFANVNKRRKEEADKMSHLKKQFGDEVQFILLLGGYFNDSYLGFEAKAGIDWAWEHRLEDLALIGL